MAPRRRQTKNSKRADSIFGYLIPAFLMLVAAFQVYKTGTIDKYVLAALFLFGLGALGWQVDGLLERYFEYKNRQLSNSQDSSEAKPGETDDNANA